MTQRISLLIAVEDRLSEVVARKLVESSGRPFEIANCLGKQGFGYIRNKISAFNRSAKGIPFLVLADLNSDSCPPLRINSWLSTRKHHNLIFRIAVREIETWLLADRNGFARFSGIGANHIPIDVESIGDPKQFLINLVRRSRDHSLVEDIVPAHGSTAQVGPNYDRRLGGFVNGIWDIASAAGVSPSLARSLDCLQSFMPLGLAFDG